MKRLMVILVLIGLTGCAKVKPIVMYTCMGCKALLSSGVCSMSVSPENPPCEPGKQLVIDNWEKVTRKGAMPVYVCEKVKEK